MPERNEYILEVRYKPNPKILDYRGSWAEGISSHMALKHWQITENRIDVYDDDNFLHGFVGFKNAGFVARDTSTKTHFSGIALKFFRYLFSLEGFGSELFVKRLGVRGRFSRAFNGTFDELVSRYLERYFSVSQSTLKILDAKIIDVGGPLNFQDTRGKFNTMSGPMRKEQLMEFLERDAKDLPNVSLYFDIDYWIEPEDILNDRSIIGHIKDFSEIAWEKFEGIAGLILKD